MASRGRIESNAWLRVHCADVGGRVLSVGSMDDADGQGSRYRAYFPRCTNYTTSEVSPYPGCDLVIDVRRMPEIVDESFDGIFCSGVLEHVDDFEAAMRELTRILRSGGTLLLGLPFRQAIHLAPTDYWRFTEYGVRALLGRHGYEIVTIAPIDVAEDGFPSAYWTRAIRR